VVMNKRVLLLLTGLVLMVGTLFAIVEIHSQAQSPMTQQSPPMQGPPASADGNTVDAQGSKRYLVGPGDVLDVRIFGQADLNSTVEIDDEGNISSLPFLEQPIPAMCRNEKDIQKSIAQAYSHYLKNPRVSVRVTERRSRPPAVVFGAVRAPTRIQMMRRVRLHELLVAAGGIALNASGQIQIVHTEREMCAQDSILTPDLAEALAKQGMSTSTYDKAPATTGTDKTVVAPVSGSSKVSSFAPPAGATPVANSSDQPKPASATTDQEQNLSDIGKIEVYEVGDVRTGLGKDDPYIRPGDIVIVTEGEPIYVTGMLNAPREIVMKDNMTLLRAIAMAGGIQRTAKSHEVYVYRQVKGKLGPEKLKFDYDAIKNGKQPDVLLQAYDIIDVRPQGAFSPANMRDMLLGITRSGITGAGTSLPYRVMY
jgi:polysaccharide export outer membrane protein